MPTQTTGGSAARPGGIRGTRTTGRPQQPSGGGALTSMDRMMRYVGYLNLVFGEDPRGQSGGIPGGMGLLNLGAAGQVIFAIVSIASTLLAVGKLVLAARTAIRTGLRAAAQRVASQLRRLVPAARAVINRAAGFLRTQLARAAGAVRSALTRALAPHLPSGPLVQAYRFATRSDPRTLLPNLARASRFTQWRVNQMMRFRWYREWRAHRHMLGDIRNSPFVSLLIHPHLGARSTDPWLRTIITGVPGLPGVRRAPDLARFWVPAERLIGPRAANALSQAETEVVYWGRELVRYLEKWGGNPY
jgi:hypothetical protein